MGFNDILKLAAKYDLTDEERYLLLKIENSDLHHIRDDDIAKSDIETIKNLVEKGFLKHKRSGKYQGYAVSSKGCWALETFVTD